MQKQLGRATVIYSRDPAILRTAVGEDAREAEDAKIKKALLHFKETGELKGLKLRDGRKPAKWHLRDLPLRPWEEVSSLLRSGANEIGARQAVRHGLVNAEDATDENGVPLKLDREDGDDGPLSMAAVELLFNRYRHRLITELGLHIINLCNLDPQ